MSRMAASELGTLLVVVTVVLSAFFGQAFAATRAQDVTALNGLLEAWGSSGKSLKWVGDPCLDLWKGIQCDVNNATVISLSLDSSNLVGHLPADIAGLTGLKTLALSLNGLTGSLPQEIGSLSNLSTLSLQWCNFSGTIPKEVGNLLKLEFLGLNGNNFNGAIPNTLGNLKALTWLDLSENQISGPLPVSKDFNPPVGLDTMDNITHFHLNNNSLTGSIPAEVFALKNLIHLILDHNSLTGEIPTEIGSTPNLTIMRVDFNEIGGPIPDKLSNATSFTDLNFRHNKIGGVVPNLTSLTKLEFLDVSENSLDPQEFPTWVLDFKNIKTLSMSQNNISGPLPSAVFSIGTIQALEFNGNNINGSLTFPALVSNTLLSVKLEDNDIIGFVGSPTNRLQELSLAGNPLCDYEQLMPSSNTCIHLEYRDPWIQSNSCHEPCANGNQWNPKSDCKCSIPLTVTLMLTSPSSLNLNAGLTKLEDELASKLSGVEEYKVTLQAKQVFLKQATIMQDQRIETIFLFFPLDGSRLTNLEQDNIVKILREHKIDLTEGPYNLPDAVKESVTTSDKTHLSTKAIIGIAAGSFVAFLLVGGALLLAVREKRRLYAAKNPFAAWAGESAGDAPKLRSLRYFSLAELKAATKNWSEDNEIGVGGYGKVYRGIINTGDAVAIKRAQEGSMQGASEFKNEIELLSRVHHRNLVELVGFCYEGGVQALVYEFMSNGTLRDHIQGRGEAPLTWEMRLNIILGSARGLSYLHDHANPPIIHRDIKSANILLNDKMIAKVADFGLSKNAPDEGEKMVYSTEVKGTLGYLDPEYYLTHQFTDKSDVYSFGVVMLECLTGRDPINNRKFVVREIQTALDNGGWTGLRPVLDPHLRGTPDKQLEPFLAIALRCVEEAGAGRPSTTQIVKELEMFVVGAQPESAVQKVDTGNRSPEIYSDTQSLVKGSPKDQNPDSPFQYSGAYGVTTTIHPK